MWDVGNVRRCPFHWFARPTNAIRYTQTVQVLGFLELPVGWVTVRDPGPAILLRGGVHLRRQRSD